MESVVATESYVPCMHSHTSMEYLPIKTTTTFLVVAPGSTVEYCMKGNRRSNLHLMFMFMLCWHYHLKCCCVLSLWPPFHVSHTTREPSQQWLSVRGLIILLSCELESIFYSRCYPAVTDESVYSPGGVVHLNIDSSFVGSSPMNSNRNIKVGKTSSIYPSYRCTSTINHFIRFTLPLNNRRSFNLIASP